MGPQAVLTAEARGEDPGLGLRVSKYRVILRAGSASESLTKSSFVMMVRGLLESPEGSRGGELGALETMFL